MQHGATDVLTYKQRRRCMSANKRADTKPEMGLRRALWSMGIRYRLGLLLPGRPDIVIMRRRVAIFVDGCFWHGCPEHFTIPKTRREFWLGKIQGNRRRDSAVTSELESLGWYVIRVWEHDIRRDVLGVASRVAETIHLCDSLEHPRMYTAPPTQKAVTARSDCQSACRYTPDS